jgi:hypothetical protein
MTKELHRRLATLETIAYPPAFVTGWTITRAGELVGFVPSCGRPDPNLQAWLADPSVGFVFLTTRDESEISPEDRAELIPAEHASAQARELVAPYLEPGRALHLT